MDALLAVDIHGSLLCHRKLRPMTQKRSAGCALARRRNMSQVTALGARMCLGTFFLIYQEILLKLPMITDDRADDTDTERKEMWKCYYF